MNATQIRAELKKYASKEKARILQRFFKTGPGEYAQGDIFWGIAVPDTRKVTAKYSDISFEETESLLKNPIHEARLAALLILVKQSKNDPKAAYEIYLRNTKYINNWDLVDLSAEHVIGAYLEGKDKTILKKLTQSKSLWERRIAIMATFHFIKKREPGLTLEIARNLLEDKEDLIQKAIGWMLREVGKRCSQKIEEDFLEEYANKMPRTMLRYAIERFPEKQRKYYLNLKNV